MSLRNWLRSLLANNSHKPAPRTRLRPCVEQLEERAVPTVGLQSALGIGSGAGGAVPYDLAVDTAGNSYLTGFFIGTMDFDPTHTYAGDADVLTARGGDDIFLAKYAPDNSLVWACRMGGDVPRINSTIIDTGRDLAVDGAGNVYVTGKFEGTADFGSFSRTSSGQSDGFVAKLSPAGAVLWAQRWGTALDEDSNGVGVDAAGNVYALGARYYADASSTYYTVHDNQGLDVLKFSPSGSAVWTKSVNTRSLPIWHDLAVNVGGEVFVSGTFNGSVDFDPGAKTKTFSSGVSDSGFVFKLTSAGNYDWASTFYGQYSAQTTGYSTAQSIALDGSGNVLVGGWYRGPVDFNPSSATTTLPTIGGGYVAKLTSRGALTWARALEGAGSATVYGLAVDSAGAVYATGSLRGTLDFDPGSGSQLRSSVEGSAGTGDVYILKLDAAGTYAWAETFGSTENDLGLGVAVDSAGTVYLAGSYFGTIDFDPDPTATYELTNSGHTNIFLVRLSQR